MAMKSLKYKKDIPVKYVVDIFIAGGGPAGIAAGVTAARQSKKVFLAEAHCCFGGMSTAGLVPLFMQFSDGKNFLASGFGSEIFKAVKKAGGIFYGKKYLSIPAEKLKRIYDNLAQQSEMDFSFQTSLIDTIVENNKIQYAICSAKSGIFAVKAKAFIDCTGDGDLAFQAGADFQKGDESGNLMPATLCSLWANVDWKNVDPPDNQIMLKLLEQAFKDKIFTTEDWHHTGMAQTGQALGSANMGHIFDFDGTDEKSLTKAFLTARAYMPEFEKFYRNYVKGYQNAELAATGSLMGIRETRRITCDYTLDTQDYKKRQHFPDQIGCYCYEIDIHPSSSSKEDYESSAEEYFSSRYQKGEHYGIPLSCLTVKNFENLMVAGRCISTDRAMQSSTRTMPGCFITGQAAAIASVDSIDQNCPAKKINIDKLQAQLKTLGAFIEK